MNGGEVMRVPKDNFPTLETERMRLRRVTIDDAADMFAYCSDKEVAKYVNWDAHQSMADTHIFLNLILNQYKGNNYVFWGIQDKQTHHLIGTINFVSWKKKHRTAEIAYIISRDYWGRGMMTEAAMRVIAYGFTEMNLVRIQARCFRENLASERVMEKVGMTFEGIMRMAMQVNGIHYDLKLYSILNHEFDAG